MHKDDVIELLTDPRIHNCSPAEFSGSDDPELWVPGVFVWNCLLTDSLAVMGLSPTEDGGIEGFGLLFTSDSCSVFLPVGLSPHSSCELALTGKLLADLTGLDHQIRALLAHHLSWASNYPASDTHEDSDEEQVAGLAEKSE